MKILFVTRHPMNWYGGGEKILETVFDYFTGKKNDCYILNFIMEDKICNYNEWVAPYNKYPDRIFLKKLKSVSKNQSLFYSLLYRVYGKYDYGTNEVRNIVESIGAIDLIVVIPVFLMGGVRKAVQEIGSTAKIVFWDHGSISEMTRTISYRDRFRRILITPVLWKWVGCADAVLAISFALSNTIKKYIPEMDIRVVYNPVGKKPANMIRKPRKPIFYYIGRLDNYSKNITFLLNALSEIKNKEWKLVVFGEGPDRDFLEKKAYKLGISHRVEWRGFVENPMDSVEEGTCLILTSRAEGFPLVLIEAIERGLPAISADCPTGPSEIVIPGQNGFLYEPGDREQLITLLKACIDGNMKLPPAEVIAKTVDKYEKGTILAIIEQALSEIVNNA